MSRTKLSSINEFNSMERNRSVSRSYVSHTLRTGTPTRSISLAATPTRSISLAATPTRSSPFCTPSRVRMSEDVDVSVTRSGTPYKPANEHSMTPGGTVENYAMVDLTDPNINNNNNNNDNINNNNNTSMSSSRYINRKQDDLNIKNKLNKSLSTMKQSKHGPSMAGDNLISRSIKNCFSSITSTITPGSVSEHAKDSSKKRSKRRSSDNPSNKFRILLMVIFPVIICIIIGLLHRNKQFETLNTFITSYTSSHTYSEESSHTMTEAVSSEHKQVISSIGGATTKQCCDNSAIESAIRESGRDERVQKMDTYIAGIRREIDVLNNEIFRLKIIGDRQLEANQFTIKELKQSRALSEKRIEEISDKLVAIASVSKSKVEYPLVDVTQLANKNEVKMMIKGALEMYAADKLGIVDYALESLGASIMSHSNSYELRTAKVSFLGVNLWYTGNSPRSIIQSQTSPGECWAFAGSQGYATIHLSMPVLIRSVTLDHIPSALSLTGIVDSAPKQFAIMGLQSEHDSNAKLLGTFTYDIFSTPIQTFHIEEKNVAVYPIIKFIVKNNNGNDKFTCVYRIRVHGSPSK